MPNQNKEYINKLKHSVLILILQTNLTRKTSFSHLLGTLSARNAFFEK